MRMTTCWRRFLLRVLKIALPICLVIWGGFAWVAYYLPPDVVDTTDGDRIK